MRQDVEFLCDIFVYRPANLRPASAAGSVGLQVDDQEKPGDSPPSSSEAEV